MNAKFLNIQKYFRKNRIRFFFIINVILNLKKRVCLVMIRNKQGKETHSFSFLYEID